MQLSIGPAVLFNHYFADKERTGFMFQDMIGAGVVLGKHQQYLISLHAVHYSNGNLMKPNHGISAPFMATLGYYFS